MSNSVISFLFILLFLPFTQTIDEDYLTGTWEVVSVENEPTEPPFNLMVSSFKDAKFYLNQDRSTRIVSDTETRWFKYLKDSLIDRSTWSLENTEKKKTLVFSYKYIVTKIGVEKKDKDILFNIFQERGEEQTMVLKMRKEN